MHPLAPLTFTLCLLLPLAAAPSFAEDGKSAPASSPKATQQAQSALARLEAELSPPAASASAAQRPAAATKSGAGKSTQDKLTEEHQRAKDGGYDREFHRAIKENGGSRLKEEWEKNCKARVASAKDAKGSADLAELNCY